MQAFLISLGLYALFLLGITFQNWWVSRQRNRSFWLVIVNLELVVFLMIYFFVLGGDRLFQSWESINALIALGFYFGGLTLFHYTFLKGKHLLRKTEAARQMKLIIPFGVPFLCIVILLDFLSLLPTLWQDAALIATSVVIFMGMLFFLPTMICKSWGCIPLQDQESLQRLEALCTKAGFKHAGILEWTVMNHTPTAAIIGILPWFRYVLFSRYLIHALPEEAIDAILVHEIGHSQRKHMIIYPFIILGMTVATAFIGLVFDWTLTDWHHPYYRPIALFLCYALVLALYFRIIFGYFSRMFERQADLHILQVNLPIQDMITALDEVGIHSGKTRFSS